ncbi:hypothetical protein HHL16_20485 [Pseudoflavitalea sp. G-6-1-2]|uniref:hypothetical protein n=1 Tax=Pseudoflavitalea sp. G-6-1-2 TaxID=2728841 RepID=UPI001469B943|nr:hypothetical protein [Pseudoflavitalea sp. G-6-1-2]NML23268.1 hypothetical protein [Pseudoflavitalea sp. G-6-1-2]
MIKLSELRSGDLVKAKYEGQMIEGAVTEVNREDKEVGVETDVQEYFFTPDSLFPIPLDENQLFKLGFSRNVLDDGAVKYMRNSFRLMIPKDGDFSTMELWWREDRRHLVQPINVHELQNHYHQMTKVDLTPA